jgi:excisionase family DNA binding protein
MAFGIEDAACALSVGRGKIYALIAKERIRTIKIGGRRLIFRTELERLIAEGDGSTSRRGFNAREAVLCRKDRVTAK